MPVHSHGEVSHDHPDDAPGHTHDTDAAPPPVRDERTEDHEAAEHDRPATTDHDRAAVRDDHPTVGRAAVAGSLVARIILTVLGAAAMVLGAFLDWVGDAGFNAVGTEIEWTVFFSTSVDQVGLLTSAGLVVIVLGVLAAVGLIPPRGWLTRLAGALGIIAFVLVLISLYRAEGSVANARIGLWLVLIGGVLAVIGGFLGPRVRGDALT